MLLVFACCVVYIEGMVEPLKRVRTEQVQKEARRYSLAMLERMIAIGLGNVLSTGKPAPVAAQFEAQKYVLERGIGKIPTVVELDVDMNVTEMSQKQLEKIVAGHMIEGVCEEVQADEEPSCD